jgi:Amt family ammonium transporter
MPGWQQDNGTHNLNGVMKVVSLILIFLALLILAAPPAARSQATPAPAPTPTLEQRVAGLEAYIANTDPQRALRSADGTVPAGLTMPTVGVAGPGHNAWLMMSTVLVLFMTLPGLALSYSGLVRRKNAASVLAQCFAIAGLATIIWWACGYSFVFAPGHPWIGDLRYAMFRGVGPAPNTSYSFWVSQNIFAIFELMFAIITPAIIVGATAERMRFAAVLSFTALWLFLVFFPITHMVWGTDGAMNGLNNPRALIKSIDFAGGLVVHMSSGWSSLVICIMLGKRMGYGREKLAPHSIVLCMVGTAMLWVGWYGFNAGSALGVDAVATNAFVVTTLAAAVGSCAWAFAEFLHTGKSSLLGLCSGAIGGLVVAAPSSGYVSAGSGIFLGVIGGIAPWFAVVKLKPLLGYDDALDAFGVHAIGGTLGVLLTGFLARTEINPRLALHLGGLVGHTLWLQQLEAIFVTIAVAVAGTFIAGAIVMVVVGLRPSEDIEALGLDLAEHGEEGYIL